MSETISRRDFLRVGGLSFGALASRPMYDLLPGQRDSTPIGVGRVTIAEIGLFKRPDLESQRIKGLPRDTLIRLEETVISDGPPLNRKWYRVEGGFIHSAYIQRVEGSRLNQPLLYVTRAGRLGEVSVPFTNSLMREGDRWEALYRLYYQSVHWITGVLIGPDGKAWYKLTDELLRLDYYVPAHHVRPVEPEELAPISPDVPPGQKRIEVSLVDQTVAAFEGNKVVLNTKVSTGLPSLVQASGLPTLTPRGRFKIGPKVPSKHMGDGQVTSDIEAYELPGVPWVSFFVHDIGVAFHGTYWHDNFGARMSHGCVNMRIEDAKWLYRWSAPTAQANDWTRHGWGTPVTVL